MRSESKRLSPEYAARTSLPGRRSLRKADQLLQNKELEASEERKKKAKQLELQRKEMLRNSRSALPRTSSTPTYTPVPRPPVPDTYDAYEAERLNASK